MTVLFIDLRSGSVFKKKCAATSLVVCGIIAIYVIPIIQWIVILCNLSIIGVWSICIAFTSLALMIHASILITPVVIAFYLGMPEDGYEDRKVVEYAKLVRVEGDGLVRLGTHLELREDMYGLTVLCFLNDEALDEGLEFEE